MGSKGLMTNGFFSLKGGSVTNRLWVSYDSVTFRLWFSPLSESDAKLRRLKMVVVVYGRFIWKHLMTPLWRGNKRWAFSVNNKNNIARGECFWTSAALIEFLILWFLYWKYWYSVFCKSKADSQENNHDFIHHQMFFIFAGVRGLTLLAKARCIVFHANAVDCRK